MNFYLDIIDTIDDTHTTALEQAAKDSIVLKYKGKDAKDELQIVGSSLSFRMLVPFQENETVDAAFLHLFTGDERRYKVELRQDEDDALLWHGYLLPDAYNEPYKNGAAFIGFEATDGLGRLKGKFLEDDFYEKEKSVTEIVAACLKLTGLDMELVFAPAIDNRVEKDWAKIFLETALFINKKKKKDAYAILESLCNTLVSTVYQHFGGWLFEGLNKRDLVSYPAKRYDTNGVYLADTIRTKQVRDIETKALKQPQVTMVPPYGVVELDYKQESIAFPDTIAKEKNEGWTPAAGVVEQISTTDWFGTSTFRSIAKGPDYKVYMLGQIGLDFTKFMRLTRKIFIPKDRKIRLTLELQVDFLGDDNDEEIVNLIEADYWKNPIFYMVEHAENILFSNFSGEVINLENIQFQRDKTSKNVYEFITANDGLLDLVFFKPFTDFNITKIKGVFVNALKIEDISFDEDVLMQRSLTQEYTSKKEISLDYYDNSSGFGSAFRLFRLNTIHPSSFNVITVSVNHSFTQNGNFYSQVSLFGANLIADNIQATVHNEMVLTGLEVIYNYAFGEQMVIKTPYEIQAGQEFKVIQFRFFDFDLDRTNWEEWTDSVYFVERERLGEAVLNVYQRLFSTPLAQVDITTKRTLVFFGDLVRWNYREASNYAPLSLAINFDSGKTSLTMSEVAYLQSDELLPPIVDAGPDLFLYGNSSEVSINATAFDPDGQIVSYQWSFVEGSGTIQSPISEDTTVTGLVNDTYELEIEVTDNDGLTASDTVRVLRVIDYTLSLSEISFESITSISQLEQIGRYQLNVSPSLPNDFSINMAVSVFVETSVNPEGASTNAEAYVKLFKNGTELEHIDITENGEQVFNAIVNYIQGDDIEVELYVLAEATASNDASANAKFTVNTATIAGYPGVVLGVPLVEELLVGIDG